MADSAAGQTDVLVVGAGPVGLTLAVDLGRRGVRCTLIEQKAAPEFLPKMERCNARTMEIFRRMGLAAKIRAAGLPADVPMDVYVILAMNEPPLLRLPYPSVAEARAQIAACNDGSMPLEPYQLISQYTLEPLLKAEAETLPSVTVRYGCEFVSLSQDADGAVGDGPRCRRRGPPTSAPATSSAATAAPARSAGSSASSCAARATCCACTRRSITAPTLYDRIPIGDGPGRGRHYHVADGQATFLIMQDSTRHWTLHAAVERPEDMAAQFERTVGIPVPYEMLYVGAVEAEPAAGGPLPRRPRVSRRRLGAPGDPDRRPRHEHRRRRRDRSVVEAPGDAAGVGRAEPAALVRDRAAPGRRPQRRRVAVRVARAAQVARAVPARHPGGDAGGAGDARDRSRGRPTSSSARRTR